MLSANVLPHADVHEHDSLKVYATHQCWMRREGIALASLWNDATLVQLQHLK